jgi:threonine/homoserine/homoserine lactone efflux protein
MEINFFLQGFIIGFTIAASIGPIAILCMRRSIANGYLSGFFSGMGVATADGLYGAVAAFGLTFISSFLLAQQIWLQIIGIIFLIYLGSKIFNDKPKNNNHHKIESKGLINDYISILFLTLVNPMTILMFTGVFAGAGLGQTANDYSSATMLTLGVFIGSATIYLILSIIFGIFSKKLKPSVMILVNKISGATVIGFAVVMILSLGKKLV